MTGSRSITTVTHRSVTLHAPALFGQTGGRVALGDLRALVERATALQVPDEAVVTVGGLTKATQWADEQCLATITLREDVDPPTDTT